MDKERDTTHWAQDRARERGGGERERGADTETEKEDRPPQCGFTQKQDVVDVALVSLASPSRVAHCIFRHRIARL